MRWMAVVVAACCLAACSGGGGDAPEPIVPAADGDPAVEAGCALGTAAVARVLGYAVDVDDREPTGAEGCTYLAADQELHPGATVVLTRTPLTEGGGELERLVARLGAAVAPTERIDGSDVSGAERGYLVVLGVAVQVGVAADGRLFTVTVAEAGVEETVGRERALELAELALAAG